MSIIFLLFAREIFAKFVQRQRTVRSLKPPWSTTGCLNYVCYLHLNSAISRKLKESIGKGSSGLVYKVYH